VSEYEYAICEKPARNHPYNVQGKKAKS